MSPLKTRTGSGSTKPLFLLIGLLMLPLTAIAQIEVLEERSTLRGLQQIELNVQLELPPTLEQQEPLLFPSVKQRVQAKLEQDGVPIVLGKAVSPSESTDYPTLLVHVNALDAGNGIIPFTVKVALYQPARLPLVRDMHTRAATWESSSVGVVSTDRLGVIVEALLNEVAIFSEEFRAVNGRRTTDDGRR
jgi:hypothetical protein